MQVVPLQIWHLEQLRTEGGLGRLADWLTPERAVALCSSPDTYCFELNGWAVGAGGLVTYWPGRAEAWAILNPKRSKWHFLAIHNRAKRYLEMSPVRRIEAIVNQDFEEGHRWVRALGFTLEADRLRSYTVEGKDASLYVRLKG